MLTFYTWGAEKLKIDEFILNPAKNEKIRKLIGDENCNSFIERLHAAKPDNPIDSFECQLYIDGQPRWYRIVTRTLWTNEEPPRCTGMLGKAVDIQDSWSKMEDLKKQASYDSLTGLLNHASAKKQIQERMRMKGNGKYALVIFDLDKFKSINDTYGHSFGDQILKYVAEKLNQSIRRGDITARIGGDEFLIFLEYRTEIESAIRRIYSSIIGSYEKVPVSVSMGVALADMLGTEYSDLFYAADQALYAVKRSGRRSYLFYNDSMQEMFSGGSDIESDAEIQKEERE